MPGKDSPFGKSPHGKFGPLAAPSAMLFPEILDARPTAPLLKHSPDPRVRSYLTHRFGPLGVAAGVLVKRLDEEPDVTIRRGLLLSLGEYVEKQLPSDARQALVPKLQAIYRTHADPGLHASAEWLLRTWKQEDWLKQVNKEWAKDKEEREKRVQGIQQLVTKDKEKALPQWYVNGQGQTMVVIPGPVQFVMGSPATEDGRDESESQHRKRISRCFAIAAKPVTVGEYRRFNQGYTFTERYAPTPDCPVVSTSWYEAAAYCNWLSKQEDIPADQWCYETNPTDQAAKLKEHYLTLAGYRLPTEAEWEYACRAGAVTSRYYGETEELLGKYGWYLQNSGERSWPVGSKKPNDVGLFDMHGNVWYWCQESYKSYPTMKEGETIEDAEDVVTVLPETSRVLRGGSFLDLSRVVRCADRYRVVPSYRDDYVGFRPARTFR